MLSGAGACRQAKITGHTTIAEIKHKINLVRVRVRLRGRVRVRVRMIMAVMPI